MGLLLCISDVLFKPYCYWSARLSHIGIVGSVAFLLIYTAVVGVSISVHWLLIYCIGGSEIYFQFRSSEKVSDLMYGRAVIREGNPFVIVILFLCVDVVLSFFFVILFLKLCIR